MSSGFRVPGSGSGTEAECSVLRRGVEALRTELGTRHSEPGTRP
jgi:hypothetical protein